MGENNNTESAATSGKRRDGGIDFGSYSLAQLEELRDNLDPAASPLNYAALLAELARRATAAPASHWTGRFTRHSGIIGWLVAKRQRAPLYGAGEIEVAGNELILRGWQRTWLGVAFQRALHVAKDKIRNAYAAEQGVHFEIERPGWIARRVEFQPTDAADRQAIMNSLPQNRTMRFDKYGAALVAFEEQLRSRCPVAWLTPLLVVLNAMAFAIMWMQSGNLASVSSAPLSLWAANIGSLTLGGNWWRLLSTLFVHAGLAHLLLNMWALWNIGRLSERLYGRWTMLVVYLGCGVIASLTSLLWDPSRTSVGASGAIFALFGAFLAHLIRQRRDIPNGIFRSHWIPALLFVGFNLYAGAGQAGIDNAAHVGGLVFGFAIGLLLKGPEAARSSANLRVRWAPAIALFVAWAGASLFYVYRTLGPMPVAQQFVAQNGWYVTGEAKSIAAWQRVAQLASAGTITEQSLGTRVRDEVLPFWVEAVPKLNAQAESLRDDEQTYVQAIAQFAQLRKEWAEAVIGATLDRRADQNQIARDKDAESLAAMARIQRLATRSDAGRLAGGLANLPFVQRLRYGISSTEEGCVESRLGYYVRVSEEDSRTDGPAMQKEIGCRAQKLLRAGNFRTLDAMFVAAAAHTADLPGGYSTLAGLTAGLSDLMESGPGTVEQYERLLAMWRRAVPDSYYPDLMEVALLQEWAWAARGHGTVDQVTQQAWALFGFRNEMAQAALDDASAKAKHDPLWCDTALSLQHDRSSELGGIEQTFWKCIAEFPGYRALYSDMLRSLMPRWFGSTDKVADFIRQATDAAPAAERDALYAQLYWIYASLERDEINIFEEARADWPRMHAGFEDLTNRYPGSDVVLNAYARFACLVGDGALYRVLRPEVAGRISATAWTQETSLESCNMKYRAP